jgi:Tol biopolymer transport system component
VDWYPDGRLLVTSESSLPDSPSCLVLILLGDGDRQRITTPPPDTLGDDEAVFSPRGDMLAFRRRTAVSAEDVYVQSLRGGHEVRRLTFSQCEFSGIVWAADGNSLIVSCHRGGTHKSLWRIPLSGEPPARLTDDGETALWPTVSHRAGRLAYVRQTLKDGVADSQIVIVEGF